MRVSGAAVVGHDHVMSVWPGRNKDRTAEENIKNIFKIFNIKK